MEEKFYDVLESALAELRDDALQEFKATDEKLRVVSGRAIKLSDMLHTNMPDGMEQTFEDYTDCVNEIRSIELEFNYRQGIKHCMMILRYIGFQTDEKLAERIVEVMERRRQ